MFDSFTSDHLFIGFLFGIFFIALLWVFKSPKRLKEYFATKEGKRIAFGIVLVLLISTVAVSVKAEETGVNYFEWGELYVGLDYTKNPSPMCDPGPKSDRLTSNLGFRANILESTDKLFALNGKITHHSCAFNGDAASYDSLGVELTYRFW